MNIIYEEDSTLKAGTIIEDNLASVQIESLHGKRTKLKASHVLFRFQTKSLPEFLQAVQKQIEELETEFLWECAGENEFHFLNFSQEYFGKQPSPVESVALLFKLHQSPMYFYKKAKGSFKAAPADNLKAALLAQQKRQQEQALLEQHTQSFKQFVLPDGFAKERLSLFYAPNKNSLMYKAFTQAHHDLNLSKHQLLMKCGAIPNIHDYHLDKFLYNYFPDGTDFPALMQPLDFDWQTLPKAEVPAFSIDDSTTTEIDDAFSVQLLENGHYRIGIHIAAPALGILPDSEVDKISQQRLSTVYMPGKKITMMPPEAIAQFTLKEGRICPAMTLYVEVEAANFTILGCDTIIEQVFIADNLRHESLRELFNHETIAHLSLEHLPEPAAYPHQKELFILWHFAKALEALRGKRDSQRDNFYDYSFIIQEDRVQITKRERNSPIDRIVEELMILVNSQWAEQLEAAHITALYRVQENGKVRMSTQPGRHQGIGVERYMWSSSPLRRYVDLINQRQLIAWLRDEEPIYSRDEKNTLFQVLRGFETTYVAYLTFQRWMERYWCLRYLMQENIKHVSGIVHKDNHVRLDDLPITLHVPYLPDIPQGERITLEIGAIDLLELTADAQFAH